MKKGLLMLLFALTAGVLAFYVTRSHQQADRKEVLLDSMPELGWLRAELKLTDAQFANASALHAAYRPKCVEMCRHIAEAHAKLESLSQAGRAMTPELEAAIRDHARVHAECQQRMLEHLYQTANLFDDHQAARYLATMVPHALDSTTGATTCPEHP